MEFQRNSLFLSLPTVVLHLCSSLGADCNTPQGCCLCFSHNEPLREDIKRRHSWSWAPSLPALPKINPLLSC